MTQGPKLSDLLGNPHGVPQKISDPVAWPAESGGVTWQQAQDAAQAIMEAPAVVIMGLDPQDIFSIVSYLLGYDMNEALEKEYGRDVLALRVEMGDDQ